MQVAEFGEGPRVVLVHGPGTWARHDTFGFGAQLELADEFQVVLPDRRGYGGSPDVERNDYRQDAEDVAELVGEGAHLVGHSSGGVVAMLAALHNPAAVRSLTLIEPACFQIALDAPVVAEAVRRNREALAAFPEGTSDEDLVRLNFESVGFPAPEPTPELVRATRTALREFPSWEAHIPVEGLTRLPVQVITGTWDVAPPAYRTHGGEPLLECARATAQRLDAEVLRVPGTSHWPHSQRADVVNPELRRFWRP
ncbi:alpha/beta hydrolase [Saccharopolyspora rhizosphaerae]|uniref:Alpha/beta hydrolase n=1 Tax=Saccharopolyspora rhizosphaerae TaxID=2492662 RepID=A0A426JTA2_9PSEU|nr:alpha/beta hydrolase [Saccharopolyspora rhizosphaerae]